MSARSTQKRPRPIQRRPSLSVLFTCVGRRVELLRAFRAAAESLEVKLTIHGADRTRLAPAMHHVDHAHILPGLTDPRYPNALVQLAERNHIDLLIPLIDSELALVSRLAPDLADVGCRAVISSTDTIRICRDKLLTFKTLRSAAIDTPESHLVSRVLKRKKHRLPYFLKPRFGSAGRGNFRIDTISQLRVLSPRVPEPIVQPFVDGVEHTLDIYTGFDGRPRCVVPRQRLEVRAGEVSKSRVVRDRAIIAVGRRVARALPGSKGLITVQCIVTPANRIRVIEINPRFGGGVPLAIRAGADFPGWLMAEHLGRKVTIRDSDVTDGLTMLRYDQSVFCRPDGSAAPS